MDRRNFIKKTSLAVGSSFVLPRFSIAKNRNANSAINVAFIGIGGVGGMAVNGVNNAGNCNLVAFCDVNESTTNWCLNNWKEKGLNIPENPKKFTDYRQMLEKMDKDIDAVCISTPDHSHFKMTLDSMQAGKHVCVQKPLVHNIWQCRQLRKARKEYKVQTQMMNQGHATNAIRLLKEWYQTGVAGDISEVHVLSGGPKWGYMYFKKPENGLPLEKEAAPEYWDLWLNQGKYNDYNKLYEPLTWRGFWDYGTGMLGDWFCHTGDAPVWSMGLYEPESVELVDVDPCFDQKVMIPNSSIVKWNFPATKERKACSMYWYDGGREMLVRPKDFDEGRATPKGTGMFMLGDKHTIETGNRPNVNPRFSNTEFWLEFRKNMPEKSIRRVRKENLYCDWVDAIRGDIPEASSNFEVAAKLTEVALLGCLVQRFGGKMLWNAKTMSSSNRPELNDFIKEPERAGWESKPI